MEGQKTTEFQDLQQSSFKLNNMNSASINVTVCSEAGHSHLKSCLEEGEFLKYRHGGAECTNSVLHIYLNIYVSYCISFEKGEYKLCIFKSL